MRLAWDLSLLFKFLSKPPISLPLSKLGPKSSRDDALMPLSRTPHSLLPHRAVRMMLPNLRWEHSPSLPETLQQIPHHSQDQASPFDMASKPTSESGHHPTFPLLPATSSLNHNLSPVWSTFSCLEFFTSHFLKEVCPYSCEFPIHDSFTLSFDPNTSQVLLLPLV